ncbi:MAG: glycerophosphodiester phosphodiesterase family protein [Anaerolineales bacterium]
MTHPLPPIPTIFAHRGASAYAPENTLAAFTLALAQGAPAIEFDVKLTADRRVVAMHDATLERTTNGAVKVSDLPLAALRELDAGGWKDPRYAGERIPTLEEIFETVGSKLFMNIELTNYSTPFDGLVNEVAALIRRHGMEKQVLFSSFFPTNLITARRLLPHVPCGQLSLPGRAGGWQRLAARFMRLEAEHPYTEDVTAQSVAQAHARGRRVHVWTVNDPADMRRLRDLGVDGIFTDDPPLAQAHFLRQ